jgi:hypothetical protein
LGTLLSEINQTLRSMKYRSHLHKVPRLVKLREMESRIVASKSWGGWAGVKVSHVSLGRWRTV